MVKLPEAAKREIIARAPFVHHDIGEIVAYHDEEGPSIDVTIRPEDTDQYAEFSLTPSDAHRLADDMHEIADVAQRAAWTPAILAEARQYLPGMTDEQIIERLNQLYNRWGGFVIGFRGKLDRRAGRALAIEVHVETLEHSVELVERHAETLSGIPELAARLAELRASLEDVKQLYIAELKAQP